MKTRLVRLSILSVLASVACLSVSAQPTSIRFLQSVKQAGLDETLTPAITDNQVQLTAALAGKTVAAPTGTITFTITSGGGFTETSPAVPVSAGSATWAVTVPTAGTYSASAAYSGDTNYQAENATASGGISVTMMPDFDFTLPTANVKRGQNWTGEVQVTPINGFTGDVTFSCGTLPEKVSCTLPATAVAEVTSKSEPPTVSLKIGTVAATVTTSFLPFLFLFGIGLRRRKKLIVAGLGLASLLALAGCGAAPRYVQDDGTPLGTFHIPITATSGALQHTKMLTVTVTQ